MRTAAVTVDATGEYVIGGVKDLRAEVDGLGVRRLPHGRVHDPAETHDRVMATSLDAKWRFGTVRRSTGTRRTPRSTTIMVEEFATLQSLALQQTLWHMGTAVLERVPEIVEVRLTAPNKHHFVVDLRRSDSRTPARSSIAADRPYGLIEATVVRDDAPPADDAWRARRGSHERRRTRRRVGCRTAIALATANVADGGGPVRRGRSCATARCSPRARTA